MVGCPMYSLCIRLSRDTPANRQTLENVANSNKNYLGKDIHGNKWYAKLNSDGSQIWVQVRNGKIDAGGVNYTPKTFNSRTGLSAANKPKQ